MGPQDSSLSDVGEQFASKIKSSPQRYRAVKITTVGPKSGPVAPNAKADLVLFLRNVHNWMTAGIAEKAFASAYAALKSGGVLGVEEHRAKPDRVQDALASDGYVQEAYVKQLAKEAGFVFEEASRSMPIFWMIAITPSASGPCPLYAGHRRLDLAPCAPVIGAWASA